MAITHRASTRLSAHLGPLLSGDIRANRIVTGGADGSVRLHQLEDGAIAAIASWNGHEDIVKSVRLSPHGLVASGSRDDTVRRWDPASGEAVTLGRHDHWVMGVAWSPDGTRVASVSEDATLRVWSAGGDEELVRQEFRWPVNDVDWSPDGGLLALAGGDRKLYLVDAATAEIVQTLKGATQMLWAVRFSPDGKWVAWTGRDRLVRITHLGDQKTVEAEGHGAQVWSINWSPPGDRVVSGSADRSARVWGGDGAPLELIPAPEWVRFAGWAGTSLVTGNEAGTLTVFEDDGSSVAPPQASVTTEAAPACPHFDPKVTETDMTDCQECASTRALRLCMTCGHVGCCESQVAHGTKHWEDTGHPVTTPTPVGEFPWRWCYECDTYIKKAS